jgi:hypothetical protein
MSLAWSTVTRDSGVGPPVGAGGGRCGLCDGEAWRIEMLSRQVKTLSRLMQEGSYCRKDTIVQRIDQSDGCPGSRHGVVLDEQKRLVFGDRLSISLQHVATPYFTSSQNDVAMYPPVSRR